jgi:HAD superfamily hydrolase (TIGR01509 family)
MSGFRAVAWDIDGTLIDSELLHQRALIESSAAFGVDLSDLPDQAFRGVHAFDVWSALRPRFPPGTERQPWLAAIERFYVAQAQSLAPTPGAIEAIHALATRGFPQACVSNSGRAIVDANLEALGIRQLMAFSISLDDVSEGKPSPEPFLKAARHFGLPASTIVAVEDSVAGVSSARAAGLYVIGYAPVGGAFVGADRSIAQLSELLEMFEARLPASVSKDG